MKNLRALLVASILVVTLLAAPSEAGKTEAFLDMPVKTAYVTRGRCLNDEAVLQPSLTATRGGFSFSWWGNMNLTDRLSKDAFEFVEHDVYVRYAFACPITGAEMSVGFISYDFPNVDLSRVLDAVSEGNEGVPPLNPSDMLPASQEIAFTVALPEWLLEPKIELFYDFKKAKGFYIRLNVAHSLKLAGDSVVLLSGSVGAADDDMANHSFPGSKGGLTDYRLAADLPIPVGSNAYLAPGVAYTSLLGDARDLVESNDFFYFGKTDMVIGSLTLRYNF